MSVIAIFSGTFCKEEAVIREILSAIDYRLVTESEVVTEASKASGIGESKIRRAFSAKASVFNKFTHEKERSIAQIKLALAAKLSEDRLLLSGYTGHLVPRRVSHALRVCRIGDMKFRISEAVLTQALPEKEAGKIIRKEHDGRAAPYDLYNADEVFCATTAGGIIPITDVDHRKIGDGHPGFITARISRICQHMHVDPKYSTPVYDAAPGS